MDLYEQFTKLTDLSQRLELYNNLHNEICHYAQKSAENFCCFLKSIQKMKKCKYYESVGFSSFEEYAETQLGIKRRQAYNYLEIAEKLPEDFIKGNAELGVTKLQLLTTFDEKERTDLMKKIDFKSLSVAKIKTQIEEERNKNEEESIVETSTVDYSFESRSKVRKFLNDFENWPVKTLNDLMIVREYILKNGDKIRAVMCSRSSDFSFFVSSNPSFKAENLKEFVCFFASFNKGPFVKVSKTVLERYFSLVGDLL
jgi:hypothetical protein